MALGADQIQGYFTSTGETIRLNIPIGTDTCEVWNYTKAAATGSNSFYFYWQRGMADQGGIRQFKAGTNATSTNVNNSTTPGFTLFNDADQSLSAPVTVSAVSNATQPVVSTGNTLGMVTGDVVQLYNISVQGNLVAFPFEVDTVVANTSFTMRYALANVPGAQTTVSSSAYRVIYNNDQAFYPRNKYIIDITPGQTTTILTSVTHGYQIGQTILFAIPSAFGMVELDGLSGTIVAVDLTANTFTVDIDSSGFTAFAWPTTAITNFALSTPAYMNTAVANQYMVDPYNDARRNENARGLILYAGANGPAGENGDLIFWKVTSSTTDYIALPVE